jgi:excisionase family DNA binding protein
MSKKYLSLEEAAARLGIEKAELNRLREKGSIRAFADRGNWKFKEEDVDNLARNRSLSSDDDLISPTSEESKTFEFPTGDSSGDLIFSDDELSGTHPTLITKGGTSDSSSDSDVRLIFDDLPEKGSRTSSLSSTGKSDSSVQLTRKESGSFTAAQSDSDVKLVRERPTSLGSDSDVKLVSSKSSTELAKSAGSSSNVLDDDGISLSAGSGIPLGGDSGISLEMPNDSGISLSHESVTLGRGDSGISLAIDEDEGISLAETPVLKDVEPKKPAAGKASPPAKSAPGKSGKAAPIKAATDDDDLSSSTIPVIDQRQVLGSDEVIPVLGSGDVDAAPSSETSVITLDDDSNDYATADSGSAEIAVEDDEEVDEDLTSGESASEMAGPRPTLAVEQDWGTWPLVGMALSTVLMLPLGVLMFDLVRNLWHTDVNSRNPMASMLLDLFK